MTAKELIAKQVETSIDGLLRNARAMPPEKLTWEPSPDSRSALSMLQECAQSPRFAAGMLKNRAVPDFNQEMMEATRREREQWDTPDKCEAELRVRLAEMLEALEAFPDGDLNETLFLPFTGKDHPYWELAQYPFWNNVWHTAQIAYIQTMYGDCDMH